MDIWHLTRDHAKDPAEWDAATAFVVVAPNSYTACRVAALEAGDEGADTWVLGARTEHIGTAFPDVEPGVVVCSRTVR